MFRPNLSTLLIFHYFALWEQSGSKPSPGCLRWIFESEDPYQPGHPTKVGIKVTNCEKVVLPTMEVTGVGTAIEFEESTDMQGVLVATDCEKGINLKGETGMKIDMSDSEFERVGTVLSSPSDAEHEVKLAGSKYKDVIKVIDLYIPQERLNQNNIPVNTVEEKELLAEILLQLKEMKSSPETEKLQAIEKSRFWGCIGNTSSLMTIGTTLFELAKLLP